MDSVQKWNDDHQKEQAKRLAKSRAEKKKGASETSVLAALVTWFLKLVGR